MLLPTIEVLEIIEILVATLEEACLKRGIFISAALHIILKRGFVGP
jgi:hypothetical protein